MPPLRPPTAADRAFGGRLLEPQDVGSLGFSSAGYERLFGRSGHQSALSGGRPAARLAPRGWWSPPSSPNALAVLLARPLHACARADGREVERRSAATGPCTARLPTANSTRPRRPPARAPGCWRAHPEEGAGELASWPDGVRSASGRGSQRFPPHRLVGRGSRGGAAGALRPADAPMRLSADAGRGRRPAWRRRWPCPYPSFPPRARSRMVAAVEVALAAARRSPAARGPTPPAWQR